MPDDKRQLSEIDGQLLDLLARRVSIFGRLNSDTMSMEDASVDLDKLGRLEQEDIRAWLSHTNSLCARAIGKEVKVAYLGPLYSYSYLAGAQHFGLASNFVPVSTISGVFDALLRKQCDFGIVPIENSTDGRVVDTLGMLAREPVKICAEVNYPIHHCLLANCKMEEIEEVRSKPQAISQCRGWLANYLPNAKQIEVSSTAAAAVAAAKNHGTAAIASQEAGIHNNLMLVAENIEDNQNNVTRFAVIGHAETSPTGRDKTALMLQLHHRPGALASAMQIFNQSDLNLTWIESFPMPGRPSEYLFFVEVEGHVGEEAVRGAVSRLRKEALQVEVLGAYPRG